MCRPQTLLSLSTSIALSVCDKWESIDAAGAADAADAVNSTSGSDEDAVPALRLSGGSREPGVDWNRRAEMEEPRRMFSALSIPRPATSKSSTRRRPCIDCAK